MADGFDPLFRRVVGVPRLYLLAERLEARSRKDETFVATGALTFEAPGANEQVGRRSDWEPVPDLHAAYVTFAAGNPASIRTAADWVASSYVSGLFGGRVVSDFDEHVPRFVGAPLEVARVAAAMLEPHAVKRIVDKTGPQRDVSELFVHRAERLSATACDFFISYTAADRVWAEWIAWRLEAAGYTTVLQAWDFRPGGAWVTQMQAAMTTARRTIAVLSPDYLSSVHGAAEWQAAYAEDPDGSAGRLVPVRVRECQPEGLLAIRTWIDLIGLDADGARDALLAGIERRRAKPSREPAFPGTVPATPFPAP